MHASYEAYRDGTTVMTILVVTMQETFSRYLRVAISQIGRNSNTLTCLQSGHPLNTSKVPLIYCKINYSHHRLNVLYKTMPPGSLLLWNAIDHFE